jgi:uncharacterized SAM-binding protein YcdF (DUF218 family)
MAALRGDIRFRYLKQFFLIISLLYLIIVFLLFVNQPLLQWKKWPYKRGGLS